MRLPRRDSVAARPLPGPRRGGTHSYLPGRGARGFHEEVRCCQVEGLGWGCFPLRRDQASIRTRVAAESMWAAVLVVVRLTRSWRRCSLFFGLVLGPATGAQSPPDSSSKIDTLSSDSLCVASVSVPPPSKKFLLAALAYAVCASPIVGSKSSSVRHSVCSSTASLRATATAARFLPRLLVPASFSPQRFNAQSSPFRPRT